MESLPDLIGQAPYKTQAGFLKKQERIGIGDPRSGLNFFSYLLKIGREGCSRNHNDAKISWFIVYGLWFMVWVVSVF